jgi:hypothetical protein
MWSHAIRCSIHSEGAYYLCTLCRTLSQFSVFFIYSLFTFSFFHSMFLQIVGTYLPASHLRKPFSSSSITYVIKKLSAVMECDDLLSLSQKPDLFIILRAIVNKIRIFVPYSFKIHSNIIFSSVSKV